MQTPETLLALDEAKRAVRARMLSPGTSPSTAAEQLRQLEGLEQAKRAAAGSNPSQVTVSTTVTK